MIEYKGYIGIVEFDRDIDSFHGTVINTNDVITFYGKSVAQLRQEMANSIEEYLEFCQEEGIEPEPPYSGKLIIQTTPELHRRIALEAARNHISSSAYAERVLEKAMITAS